MNFVLILIPMAGYALNLRAEEANRIKPKQDLIQVKKYLLIYETNYRIHNSYEFITQQLSTET
jgi:16S rRNA C1402 (ribose-2'-O) methylase RsmI